MQASHQICVLYSNIHFLQEDPDSLALWEADWQVKFYVAKCHSMRVTRHYSNNQILHDFTLQQQTLENVQSTKHIGITITENMDWVKHIFDISSNGKATKAALNHPLRILVMNCQSINNKKA